MGEKGVKKRLNKSTAKLYMIKMEEINNQNNKIKEKVSIRKCPHCHQDVEVNVGFSKKNIKNLFRKPTIEECIVLFIILVAVISFLGYRINIEMYETYIEENCTCSYDYNQDHNQDKINKDINFDFTEFQDGNKKESEKGTG